MSNTTIYKGIPVRTSNTGERYVRRSDIPAGVDYPKRFSARLIANRLNITEAAVYNNIAVVKRNGTSTYSISKNAANKFLSDVH